MRTWSAVMRWIAVALLAAGACVVPRPAYAQPAGAPTAIDDFDDSLRWTPHPADGVRMKLGLDAGRRGRAMRMDFAFTGGGYAIARRAVALDVPENYEISFWIRGDAPTENLELKLIDSTGANVWWMNRRDFVIPRQWQRLSTKKRQISFAWGPIGGGDIRRIAAIEIVVTAGTGGTGTVWIDDLVLTPRDPVVKDPPRAVATARSSAIGSEASAVVDADTMRGWRSASTAGAQSLALDFTQPREYGGLVIDWMPGERAIDYDVQSSADGRAWETVRAVRGGDGPRDFLYLPDSESRWLRLLLLRGAGTSYGIREISVPPAEWSATRTAFFEAVARAAPRGDYPKQLLGVQSYWTIIGVNGDDKEALLNEQGQLEPDKLSFSIEPFLFTNGRLITWADVSTAPSLADSELPIPSVAWTAGPLRLTTTAYAGGRPDSSILYSRYHLENRGGTSRDVTLYLAIRPFQVNPPAQFLNTPGGAAVVRSIAYDGTIVRVGGLETVKTIVPITTPTGFGAATFDGGGIVSWLHRGALPRAQRVQDGVAAASGALAYRLKLAPGESRDVYVAVPFHAASPRVPARLPAARADSLGAARLSQAHREWADALQRVDIQLPPAAQRVVQSLRSNLAYMLATRDGPALHPGARSYDRAWIRDGAMMSAALLRLGHPEEVKAFAEWYAPFQFPNGKVPCCVDARGADPVPENDSHGQLIYLVAEYWRFTRDTAFLRRMWPYVERAVGYIDTLRRERMTPVYRTPDSLAFYGLLPQSISHEGYSARPMHSYWDDLFALKGLSDAVDVAVVLGRRQEQARFASIRDEFRRDLIASYRRAMDMHHIDFLPGSVELGDFDATSTTVGVSPADETTHLPQPALARTFEKYYENFVARRDGRIAWEDYTPYELRVVGTMVRLGQRARAHELLDFFLHDQRPREWRQWPEVVWRDSTAAKFIGDLPHTWVGSDYIRSVMDMFAYERGADSSLVVGAGIPEAWVTADPGVIVRRLPTYYGPLDLTMRATGADARAVRVTVGGSVRVPPGGIVLRAPFDGPVRGVTVNGEAAVVDAGGGVVIRRLPAEVVLRRE